MPRMKILVVENDPFYQTYVNDLLSETGAQILNAPDGHAGFDLARSEVPDIILSEVEIPVIQGFILLKYLREDPGTREIPVIMMSGKVDRAMMERHAQLMVRADAYLCKPFSSHDLFAAIRTVLGERSAAMNLPSASHTDAAPPTQPHPHGVQRDPDAIAALPSPTPNRRTVVVVDDSRYILDVARDFLGAMGFTVVTAMDGEEAMAAVSRHHPDIVFLDVQIPKLNGFVVCERIKKDPATAGTAVVLMSAIVDRESFERHSRLRYRADAYLPKPFMKRELQGLAARLVSIPALSEQDRTSGIAAIEGEAAVRPEASPSPGVSAPEAALRGQIDSLASELDRMRRQEDLLLAERQGLGEQIRSLKEQVTRSVLAEAAIQESQARIRALEEQVARQEAERAQMTQRYEEKRARDIEDAGARTAEAGRTAAALDAARDALAKGEERWRSQEEALRKEFLRLSEESRERADGAQARAAGLEEEIKRLGQDLAAALSAKAEIEDQAKSLLHARGASEETALGSALSEARTENLSLAQRLSEAEAGLKWVDDLKAKLGDLEGKNRELAEDVRRLQGLFEGAQRESSRAGSELERERARSLDLERALKEEGDRSARAQDEVRAAHRRLDVALSDLAEERVRRTAAEERSALMAAGLEEAKRLAASAVPSEQAEQLRREREELKERNDQLAAGNEELEGRVQELTAALKAAQVPAAPARAGWEEGEAMVRSLAERLGSLETVLDRTVREAQSALKDQRDREGLLEQQVRGMASALEEERAEHRRSRERWEARDAEQRAALEQAVQERLRLAGEEISRYIPVAMARETRPLEVVRPRRGIFWVGAAAAAVLLLAAAFVLGRFWIERYDGRTADAPAAPDAAAGQRAFGDAPWALPSTAAAHETASRDYELLWRRQTVMTVSDGLMVQATLHTSEELRAAIRLAAVREGWTAQVAEQALADLERTFRFDQAYYVTVFSKNLKGGPRGYDDVLVRHLALRDAAGREVPATVPESLLEKRSITSQIAAAGKDANPVFLYDAGVTVAFPKGTLGQGAGTLQLVLYDLGAIPTRVLTWDLGSSGPAA